jgi:hypothetical protein
MNPIMWAAMLSTAVFVGTLVSLEVGIRSGRRTIAKAPEMAHEGIPSSKWQNYHCWGLGDEKPQTVQSASLP